MIQKVINYNFKARFDPVEIGVSGSIFKLKERPIDMSEHKHASQLPNKSN